MNAHVLTVAAPTFFQMKRSPGLPHPSDKYIIGQLTEIDEGSCPIYSK